MLKSNESKSRRFTALALSTALLLVLFLGGCAQVVKIPNVYITYETREDSSSTGVNFGPKKVRRLEILPDAFVMYFEDGSGKFVPIDKKLKWFKWSENAE